MSVWRRYLFNLFLFLIICAILAALTWINIRFSQQNPGGSDFLPRWLGTREFLMKGQSPYSDQTSEQIQRLFYGRLPGPDEDQVLFVYPFYSIFIFAPFALIEDYHLARAVWMTALEVSILLIALTGISLSRWKVSPLRLGLLMLFSLLFYYDVRSLINANAAILVALFICAALIAIRSGQDAWAGFFLVLSTIKPQVVVLIILFILIWSVSERRSLIVWSFLGNLALLIAITSLLIPDWTWQNLRQVLAYPGYTLPGTPGAIFIQWLPGVGRQLGWALTVLMVTTLIWEWRAALGRDFRWFIWTVCFTLVATTLIGIRTATENYIVLLPAIMLVFAAWDQEWGPFGNFLIAVSYLALLFGVWWLFVATLQVGDQPVQHPALFFPLPVFLLIGLYWVRWWVLRPERPLFNQLRDRRRILS